MNALAVALCWLGALWSGVYLCMHDFPVLGGWVCILVVLGGCSISTKKDDK
jgi:hypothetical protein